MELHGIMHKGQLTFSATQNGLRRHWLNSLKDGTKVKETLTREGKPKSGQQVKAHFGLVVELIRQKLMEIGIDVCGTPPCKEQVHEILKKACGGVGDMGESLGLSEMTTAQASVFFDNCRTWSASQLELVIPEPDKNWKWKIGSMDERTKE